MSSPMETDLVAYPRLVLAVFKRLSAGAGAQSRAASRLFRRRFELLPSPCAASGSCKSTRDLCMSSAEDATRFRLFHCSGVTSCVASLRGGV